MDNFDQEYKHKYKMENDNTVSKHTAAAQDNDNIP
jgi:hypothetical protein